MSNNKRTTTTRRNVTKSEKCVVDGVSNSTKSTVAKALTKALHDTDCRAQYVNVNVQMQIGFKENKDGNYVVRKITAPIDISTDYDDYDNTSPKVKGIAVVEESSPSSSSKGCKYVKPSDIYNEDPTRLDEIMGMLEKYSPYYEVQRDLFDYVISNTFPKWGYGEMVQNIEYRKLIYKSFNKIINGKNYKEKSNEHVYWMKGASKPNNTPTDGAMKRYGKDHSDDSNDLTPSTPSDTVSETVDTHDAPQETENISTPKEVVCPIYDLTGQKYLGNYPPDNLLWHQFGCPYQQMMYYSPMFPIK